MVEMVKIELNKIFRFDSFSQEKRKLIATVLVNLSRQSFFGSISDISVSGQLPTYPSPNSTTVN